MKTNVGNLDSIIRLVLGFALLGLGFYFKTWWGGLGLIFVVTGIIRFCPIWGACRINTTGQKKLMPLFGFEAKSNTVASTLL